MPARSEGVEAFVEGLDRCCAAPRAKDGYVVYVIEPVEGRWAGEVVETAVEVGELVRWPLVPPHWIHLPGSIVFANTNSRPSSLAGWTQHSRQIAGWGSDAEPAAGWLAHVRSVIGEAR